MRIVRSDVHRSHVPVGELHGGELVAPFERPERVDVIVTALATAGFIDVIVPSPVDDAVLLAVHDAAYLEFLRTAWSSWIAEGNTADIIPMCFPVRRMLGGVPASVSGKLGWYAFGADTSITAGTWDAAREAASIAKTAQHLVSGGDNSAFALCRPPGHHAAYDYFGGYCFLNNAAVAAQGFLDDGAQRVAVIDVDYHHGNGTQDIFYQRGDVLFASLHGDPASEFPYFSGHRDERGSGAGAGTTHNYPLPPGTTFEGWAAALDDALVQVDAFRPDALVVSLGVDTFEGDPISSFRLASDDFFSYGATLGALGLPTVLCLEGGYAVDELGANVVRVLQGFTENRR